MAAETNMIRIGHRGAAGHAPENTLKAIDCGIRLGADMIEVDVQRSRDGQLVVIHDKRVHRTTNGTGKVAELTLAELQNLDAGHGERIPTLAEVLQRVNGRAGTMLEIVSPGIGSDVVAAVRSAGFSGPVVYASFHHAELIEVRRADPRAATLALLEGIPVSPLAFAREAKATHVGLARDSVTPAFLATLRASGISIFIYTVNEPEDIAEMRALGVDGIISDYPDRLG